MGPRRGRSAAAAVLMVLVVWAGLLVEEAQGDAEFIATWQRIQREREEAEANNAAAALRSTQQGTGTYCGFVDRQGAAVDAALGDAKQGEYRCFSEACFNAVDGFQFPETETDCEFAATQLGLSLGGGGFAFVGAYGTKGCYTYTSGTYLGMAFFGSGGSSVDMLATPAAPKTRLACGGTPYSASSSSSPPASLSMTGTYYNWDASTVSSGDTTWTDSQSGIVMSQNAAMPTLATINNHAALDFSSNAGMISTGFPLQDEVTLFMVATPHASPGNWGSFAHHGNRDNDWALEYMSNQQTTVQWQSQNDNSGCQVTVVPDRDYLFAARIDATAGRTFKAIDDQGNTLTASTATGNTITESLTALFRVGQSDANEHSNAKIGQIIYFPRSLTDDEMQTVEDYLLAKWSFVTP